MHVPHPKQGIIFPLFQWFWGSFIWWIVNDTCILIIGIQLNYWWNLLALTIFPILMKSCRYIPKKQVATHKVVCFLRSNPTRGSKEILLWIYFVQNPKYPDQNDVIMKSKENYKFKGTLFVKFGFTSLSCRKFSEESKKLGPQV